ncbi:MAG: hypothetical protein AAGI89_03380 [Pseudomonadota bacterium]
MSKKVAVAVIHGIGSQANKRPQVSDQQTFSKGLYKKLRGKLGRKVMKNDVAWREIFWADILQDRQDQYLSSIGSLVKVGSVRRLLVSNFADALAFSRRGTAYDELQNRIGATIADLRRDVDEGTPLVVMAHSFGGRIMSNYMWDMQSGYFEPGQPFDQFQSLARFITFGCNLPLFSFAFPPEELEPFAYPGVGLDQRFLGEPWWQNYYDPQDLLAFPIAPVAPSYQALADDGQLADIRVNVGSVLKSWNTLSHDEYWTANQFFEPVAETLKSLIEANS